MGPVVLSGGLPSTQLLAASPAVQASSLTGRRHDKALALKRLRRSAPRRTLRLPAASAPESRCSAVAKAGPVGAVLAGFAYCRAAWRRRRCQQQRLHGRKAVAAAQTLDPPATHAAKNQSESRPWWSALLFSWADKLLARGHEPQPFDVPDLMPPPHHLTSATLAEDLKSTLQEAKKRRRKGEKGSITLLKVLVRQNSRQLIISGVLRFLNTTVQFFPVLCLSALLRAVQAGSVEDGMRSAAALFCVLSMKTLIENQFFWRVINLAFRARSTLQSSIYAKSLRLPEAAAAVPPVTLMQVDTGKVEALAYSCHTLWDGIFQVLGYSFLLIQYLGLSALSGLAVLAALFPVNAYLNQKLSALNRDSLRKSEARVAHTSEVLGGIRAIRQMSWEDVFEREVCKLRDDELAAQRRRTNVSATLVSTFSALPPFMTAVVLFAYAASTKGSWSTAFQPSIIFAALALLEQIRFPLLFYPNALDSLSEGLAALGRIANFLDLDEAPASKMADAGVRHDGAAKADTSNGALSSTATAFHVPPGRYEVSKDAGGPTLVLEEELKINPGELVAVIGTVGSGKTTLVRTLLGELQNAGVEPPAGKVAYCSQKPWVPSGRLSDVVTGGAVFDEDAFGLACNAAALDFAQARDEISAGTLSGGQQARVALARAVYHARVSEQGAACVLDDVTAALDPRVSAKVVQNCLFGVLGGRTRVVVTSDTGPLLRRCDKVVLMEKANGELKVRAVGSYSELLVRGLLDASIHQHLAEEDAAGDADMEEFVKGLENGVNGGLSPASSSTPVKLTVAEERATGAVPRSLYLRYLTCAGSPLILGAAIAAVGGTYFAAVSQQWFIGMWTADRTMRRGLSFYLGGVTLLGVLASGLTFARALLIATFGRKSSKAIHKSLCQSVLVKASSSYFDANPAGRILQRFAKDLEQVDGALPSSLRNVAACLCTLSGAMFTAVIANPRFLLALLPLTVVYVRALRYYLPVARELKRLEALARSPVYQEQGIAAEGVVTIRQLRLGELMTSRAFHAIDGNTSVTFAMKAVDRWFSIRMELLGNLVVLLSAGLALLAACAASSSPWATARAAVAVTQTLSVVGLLNWTVRTMADTETSFSSFQRVVYTSDTTTAEAPRKLGGDSGLPAAWPSKGDIKFKDVSVRYRDDLPLVLRDVNLDLRAGQRVALVGQTGCGKSTILRVLLRLVELSDTRGRIEIDGVDIKSVGLDRLRSSMTVIPQDNFLMTGTVRQNIDPQGVHSDDEIRRALDAASLDQWPLDRKIKASSGGISPGERQLVGVARALLRGSRIIALDEVTSRVDEATDREVQAALRKLPGDTTLLVVSHRLQTLRDYDVIVVLDEGRVAEIGGPSVLAGQPDSAFARLLAAESSGVDKVRVAEPAESEAAEPVLQEA
eukprot:TRINITY_DN19311_c0_g1_i2.p1 TRINITY_DN19311_c0_g1~~TRINITY_DN19311_c0_g1_i2.p1  ORF type:complete len:1428 (+),score=293.59 TRINITY_DN19311_c0_g1_i2:79-4284(+)